jgi:hypothetical protein
MQARSDSLAQRGASMDAKLDAAYFRDKAETCLRLADGLSWNNPARPKLMELAEDLKRQAKQLEAAESAPQRPAHSSRSARRQ